MDKETLDVFNPAFIIGLVIALASDLSFIFILALALPIIGLVIALGILIGHYLAGFLIALLIFAKTRGLLAKIALGLGILAPLPLLFLGVILALLLSNKFIRFAAEQAAVVATGAVTSPAGALVAAGALAAEKGLEEGQNPAEALATGALKAGEAAAIGKGGQLAGRAEQVKKIKLEEGALETAFTKEEKTGEKSGSEEALGEEKSVFEKLQEPMENMPQPDFGQEDEVELENETVNLKKAA